MRFTRNRNIFAYTFTPRTITGCWLSAPPNSSKIHMLAYHRKTIDHLELEHSYIFNPTRIAQLITSWYQDTQQSMPIGYALLGPAIQEKIVPSATAHPAFHQLPITHSPHMQWEYSYLYSYDTAHYFYVCGIQKTLLFQYQLLSINTQLPVHLITTYGMALLNTYRLLFGDAFRPSQLAVALTKCKQSIEQLFSRDDLARLLTVPTSFNPTTRDIIPLLVSCGLFAGKFNE